MTVHRLVILALALAACSTDYRSFDASTLHDAGVPDEGMVGEGGVPVSALFTVTGCDKLAFDDSGAPTCTVGPDRLVTFVPLGVGTDTLVWTFTSGQPAMSSLLTPMVSWSVAGTYVVSLAAGGVGGGSAIASGMVVVKAQAAGAACETDSDCDGTLGLTCLCGAGQGCPAGLSSGVCVQRCETTACAVGDACIDLDRGLVVTPDADGGVDGGTGDGFRVHACLPVCTTSATCRAGFACRPLPEVSVGAEPGAPYTWTQACFASVLGDVGASCDDDSGAPDGSRCTTGFCAQLGARGICTDDCSGMIDCPPDAACATMPSIGSRCLARCTTASDCTDPWLACEPAGEGGLGFSLSTSEPTGTTLCAEKRCVADSDCGAGGNCATVGGALFCGP